MLLCCWPLALFSQSQPALISPAPGSTLSGSSASFTWSTASDVVQYQLWVGTAGVGSDNLGVFTEGATTNSTISVAASGLPVAGATVYVRLFTDVAGNWHATDYTYKEASTKTASSPAALMSPAAGSVLPGASATFTWSAGSGVSSYQLWVGTTGAGSGNIGVHSYGPTTASTLSATVTGIPTNGATVYVRLFVEVQGNWQATDYTYKEASTAAALSALSCGSASMTGAGSDVCTVKLTAAAPAGGMAIALASNNSAVKVPASVTVAVGSASAGFTATVAAVSTTQTDTLTTSAGKVAKTFPVQLDAATVALSASSTSLAFGNVALSTTAMQTITLTASGTEAVKISADALTGAGFSVSGLQLPLTLNPQQSAALNVAFDPTTAGAVTGKLTLTSNAAGGSTIISLSGTGEKQSYAVDLHWDAPTNSTDPHAIAGYRIYRALSNSGSFQLLNSSLNVSTSYTDDTVAAGSSYEYEVTSVDTEGAESSPSGIYTATIQ